MPEGLKEYLVIYTTEYEDTFLLEPIAQDDFQVMKKAIQGMRERSVENEIECELKDENSGMEKRLQIVKIRKLKQKNRRKSETVIWIPLPNMRSDNR